MMTERQQRFILGVAAGAIANDIKNGRALATVVVDSAWLHSRRLPPREETWRLAESFVHSMYETCGCKWPPDWLEGEE